MAPPTILAVDLGTFCDNRLMESALEPMTKRGARVIYFTDRKHEVPRGFEVRTYETPRYMVTNPDLALADSSQSLFWAAITNPVAALQAYSFNAGLRSRMEEAVKELRPRAIIVAYPALVVVANMSPDVLKMTTVYVVYYAPGFPNRTVPWLFDTQIKRKDFVLYHSDPDENLHSGRVYINRLLTGGKLSVLNSFHHVIAWDERLTQKIVPALPWRHVHRLGALLPRDVRRRARWPDMPPETREALRGKRHVFFVSFGSYAKNPMLRPAVDAVLAGLRRFCMAHGDAVVLYHNGDRSRAPWLHNIKGFVPYNYIVPRCSMVVFTGSLCLQMVCLYHACPMVFVPLLAEQYFWAKNYQHHTGVPFVDGEHAVFDGHCIERAREPHKWQLQVASSLWKARCGESLAQLVLASRGTSS